MTKYIKNPVVIEATQWFTDGDHPSDGNNDKEGKVVCYFRHPDVADSKICKHCGNTLHVHGWIDTLEGWHIVCPGDFIITGVKGENYPCKPDVFHQTYSIYDKHAQA